MRRKVATPRPPKETFWWKKKGKKREKHFCTDVFDNTCHIDHFKEYIFCPQNTQEPPKKHNEGGLLGHLPTDALSQIGYRHTRHCKDCLSQRRTPFQNVFRLCLCIHLFICLCCWYEMQCQRLFQLLFNKLTQSNWMIRILLQYVLEKLTFSTQTQPLLCVRPWRRKTVPSEILVKVYRYIFSTVKSALLLLFYVFFLLCIYFLNNCFVLFCSVFFFFCFNSFIV